jgi:hypothetical protein
MLSRILTEATTCEVGDPALVQIVTKEFEKYYAETVVFEPESGTETLTIEVNDKKFNVLCDLSILRMYLKDIDNTTDGKITLKVDGIASLESIQVLIQYIYCDDSIRCRRLELTPRLPTNKDTIDILNEPSNEVIQWSFLLLELLSLALYFKMPTLIWINQLYLLELLVTHKFGDIILEQFCIKYGNTLEELSPETYQEVQAILKEKVTYEGPLANKHLFGDYQLQIDTETVELHSQEQVNLVDESIPSSSSNNTVPVHKSVLLARSEYFRQVINSQMLESQQKILTLPTCSDPKVLEAFVIYLYTGLVNEMEYGNISLEL